MRELLDLLLRSRIPLLVIGGHAVGAHGAERDTADVDCLVVTERREEMKAFLESRGFEETATHQSFSRYRHKSLAVPMLDVMHVETAIWERMWEKAATKEIKGVPTRVPEVGHLIALKLHAIRQNPSREFQDGDDIVRLLRANPTAISPEKLRELFARYQLLPLFERIRVIL
jgi:predicted nucleotidyltransferase